MKTVFIVNPCAGQGKNINKISKAIDMAASSVGADYEIYITKSIGDATTFVNYYCRYYGGARFIACGGDGTLNEVLNGVIGFDNSEVGVIPLGTGNDFCRNFDTDFLDITSQILSSAKKCDAIKYTTVINGKNHFGYCANMFNIGFDCNVADMTSDIKKNPFVSGSLAYIISIFAALIKKKGADLSIELDGKPMHSGALLLTSLANGSYCGGGIKTNPLACVNDGYININIVNNVSRFRFIRMLPHYIKGDFLKLKNIEKIVTSLKCKKVTIMPQGGTMRICSDGEIFDAGRTEFEIIHDAFNFVVPGVNIKTVEKALIKQEEV